MELRKINFGCGNDVKHGYENYDLNPINKNVTYIDLNDLPLKFNDNVYDVILLDQVLEHLNINPLDLMEEMHRILKKNGKIIVGLPVNSPYIYHVRYRHPKNYFRPICEKGFDIKEKYTNETWKCNAIFYTRISLKGFISKILESIRGIVYQSVYFELEK